MANRLAEALYSSIARQQLKPRWQSRGASLAPLRHRRL